MKTLELANVKNEKPEVMDALIKEHSQSIDQETLLLEFITRLILL